MDNLKKKSIKKSNSLDYADLNDNYLKRNHSSDSSQLNCSSNSPVSSDLEDVQTRSFKRNRIHHTESIKDHHLDRSIHDKNHLYHDSRSKNVSSNDHYKLDRYHTTSSNNDHHKLDRYHSTLSNNDQLDRYHSTSCNNDHHKLDRYHSTLSNDYKYQPNNINYKKTSDDRINKSDELPKLKELKLNVDHDKLIVKLKDLNIYQEMCLNELTKQDNERTNSINNLIIENQKLIDKNESTIKYFNNELNKLIFKLKDNSDDHFKLIDRANRFNIDYNELNIDDGKLIELKKLIENEKKKLDNIVKYQKEYYDQEIFNLNEQLKLKDDELTKQKREFIGKLKNQGELFKIQIDKLNKNLEKKDDELTKLKNLIKNGIKDVKDLENIMTSIDTEFSDEFKD